MTGLVLVYLGWLLLMGLIQLAVLCQPEASLPPQWERVSRRRYQGSWWWYETMDAEQLLRVAIGEERMKDDKWPRY